ncbi:PilW family protein [Acinetobacter towneri]|nr:PilW family protein [Acinetobacter towneri]NWJ93504.1 PilW family protein [Acinetobacter sp. Swhac1]
MIRNALPFEKGELEGIFKIELDTPHLTLRNNISHGWGGFSNSQSGFTLIELMIALALGLVISAAAIMLFLTGQKSYSLQQGTADLQDNANFGLNYIVKDIRLSNLNTMTSGISDETAGGGIVFRSISNKKSITSGTPPVTTDYYNLPASLTGTTVAVGMLSQGNTGLSNVNTEKSDQLVIQYKPQYVTDPDDATKLFGGFDCEGNRITVTKVAAGTPQPLNIIVQRYFLRTDTKIGNEPNASLALACDAGFYSDTGSPTTISNYGDDGQIILKRVDYFHVLLGVQNGTNFRYISIDNYMTLTGTRPRILSVQLGALIRSAQSVGSDSMIKDTQKFQVLDKEVTVKTPTAGNSKYVRQVVSQTVALRNTFGERGL